MNKAAPSWLVPVAAIFVLQTATSFLARFIPLIAPAISEEFGWHGSSIGYLTASCSLGGFTILVAGSNLIRQVGGVRTLQLCLFLGVAVMVFFLYPAMGFALTACFAMGLSNGAANPAGSEVLQRFSPPGIRNFVFSVKQAGVPLGGVLAGLIIPVLVLLAGWRIAMLACALLVLLATLATWRVGGRLNDGLAPGRWPFSRPTLHSLRVLGVPLQSLTHNRGLLRMSIVGGIFAIAQSCWFTFLVIYLIDGLEYSLGLAGALYAIMQLGGVVGRVLLGWLADRLHSAAMTLSATALVSATTTLLLGLSSPQWPLWVVVVLSFVAGASAASWNGVQIAEVARRSPPDLISETAAGSSILINLSNMVVPTAFAAFVAFTGRYDIAFGSAGACVLLVLVFLPKDVQAAAK